MNSSVVEEALLALRSWNIKSPISYCKSGSQQPQIHDRALTSIKGRKIKAVNDGQAMATMLPEFLSGYGALVDSQTDHKLVLEMFFHWLVW